MNLYRVRGYFPKTAGKSAVFAPVFVAVDDPAAALDTAAVHTLRTDGVSLFTVELHEVGTALYTGRERPFADRADLPQRGDDVVTNATPRARPSLRLVEG